MTNEEILSKLRQDIRLRGLSSATDKKYLLVASTFIKFYDNQPIFNMAEQEIRKIPLSKCMHENFSFIVEK